LCCLHIVYPLKFNNETQKRYKKPFYTSIYGEYGCQGCNTTYNPVAQPPALKRDLFKELGVTPVINASVTMTFLSGSLMLPEVLEAINSTSHDFANMFELQDKVGAKIAEMLHCEAAMVTSGASCAILLGTAACITGTDAEKIKMMPNLPGRPCRGDHAKIAQVFV
jgi:hypothetical protein